MISLQSYNQVLYHLTQLTSAFSTKSKPLPVKVKTRSKLTEKCTDKICQHNVVQVTSGIQVPIVHLDACNVPVRKERNNISLILNQLSNVRKNNKWKVSHISGYSFNDNKQGIPCSHLTEEIILPIIYLSTKQNRILHTCHFQNPFTLKVQMRQFKTERNVKMETERNLTLTSRLKKLFGHSQSADAVANKTAVMKDLAQLNLMIEKNFGDKSGLSTDEQKRLTLAFLEGYKTAVQKEKASIWQKNISQLLFFGAVFIIISVYLSVYKYSLLYKEINAEEVHVTFDDIKGIDTPKEELNNIVKFLKNPERFSAAGAKLPKGVLLVGPPGTGKTLLARAIAGEANVPFYHAVGSEFDEILVGQGARRVRDLFKIARQKAPAVIFIDEIDAIGSKRIASELHPHANQTINQLLSEMDGFIQNEGIIVLAATNRRKELDVALVRPGRFDLEISVDIPDYYGRKEIFDLYLARIVTRDVDVDTLAKNTTGFTGADIENMVNQAALRAVITDCEYVTMQHLEYARDKLKMGPEKKLRNYEDCNRLTAYHEAGHTLVSYYTKDANPLYKVTILPRGQSLGHTAFVPQEYDMRYATKSQLLAYLDVSLGGRAAEELIYGSDKVTTGASADLIQATTCAEAMVTEYGMSEKAGFRIHKQSSGEYSSSTKELIDSEVKRLIHESYERAKAILQTHAKEHKLLAEALLKYETLNAEDVKAILNGKMPQIEAGNNIKPLIMLPNSLRDLILHRIE
ncbi:hypothetical protein KM043_011393 [Ampulex compressa]|nr:hypothetical protein KM043_011393 [Ampulex compressa]